MFEAITPVHEGEFATADATSLREKVVVSPCAGRFWPLPPETFASEGEWVEPGEPVGQIGIDGQSHEVKSPFRGWVMGMLAMSGQPVREGQALFWIWSS